MARILSAMRVARTLFSSLAHPELAMIWVLMTMSSALAGLTGNVALSGGAGNDILEIEGGFLI